MEIDEAFRILELPTDADENAVRRAFRQKSLTAHPDRRGGTDESQALLNSAYQVASAVAAGQTALVAFRSGQLLQRFERDLAALKSDQNTQGQAARTRIQRTSGLQQLKRISLFLTTVTGLLAFSDKTLSFFMPALTPATRSQIAIVSSILAAGFGALSLLLQTVVKSVESQLEHYMAALADRRTCADELARALKYQDRPLVSENAIRVGVYDRTPGFPLSLLFGNKLTSEDLTPLLIGKATSHGLLVSSDSGELTPRTTFQYQLGFRPSAFAPPEESFEAGGGPDGSRLRLPSFERAFVSSQVFGLVLFGSLAAYLKFSVGTAWFWAPAVMAGSSLIVLIVTIRERILVRTGRRRRMFEEVTGPDGQSD